MMPTNTLPALLLMFLRTCLPITHPPKDDHVTCLLHEDCILPCSFNPKGAVVIHWYKEQIPVHSYYYNRDQFGLQNKHFSGRTSLFNSYIAQGNASLVLRKLKVQDRGRYKCYTSTRKGNQETFVNLAVKALIQLVKIEITEEKVTCLAQNIYPAPQLFWSTKPPTDPSSLQNQTRNMADAKGLFTIESTVSILGNVSQHAYICSVISADGSQVWTASVKQQDELLGEEGSALLIPCMVPQPQHNFTFTWTFVRTAEPVTVFTYDSRTRRVSNPMEIHAEMDVEQAHLGNGSLTLPSPDSLGHTGDYTCTYSSFHVKHQVHTRVNVTVRVADADENVCRRSWWGTAASVFIFVLTISVAVSRCFRLRGEQQKHSHADTRKQCNRRTARTDTPLLDRRALNEQRHNGLTSADLGTCATPSRDTAADKPKLDGLGASAPPASPAEGAVLKIHMDKSDVSTPGTPVMGNASRSATPMIETSEAHIHGPQTPGPHTPGLHTPGSQTPGPHTPGPHTARPHTPGSQTPGPHTPRLHTPGSQTPGLHTPGSQTPGLHTPGPHTPGSQIPGPHTPGSQTPGPHTPGSQIPGPHTPGSQIPGPHTPGSQIPGPHTPGSQTPGPHTPGVGTHVTADPGGNRCQSGSAACEAVMTGNDHEGDFQVLEGANINEISLSTQPEPSQMNGFR